MDRLGLVWEWLSSDWQWVIAVVAAPMVFEVVRLAVARRRERTSTLYSKRVESVEGIQGRLVDWRRALQAAAGAPLFENRAVLALEKASAAEEETRRYIEKRSHYLPQSTRDTIEGVRKALHSVWAGLTVGEDDAEMSSPESAEHARFRREGRKILREKIPPLMDELRDEFRRLVEGKRRRGRRGD